MAASGFMQIPPNGVDAMAVEGLADHPYVIANQRLAYGRAEPGPQVWFWRSVGHSQNCFFIESFIDEMAAAAKMDPLAFRLKHLDPKHTRHRGVLELAAAKAGWGKPAAPGVHRGIAVAEAFGSYVAEVAEVSVAADGTPKLHRVVAAVDCGLTANPLTIERQIESAICYALSAALYGKISFADGKVEQGNFHGLSSRAHERDAQGRGPHRGEQGRPRRHRRARHATAGAGPGQRHLRGHGQAHSQAAA